MSAVANIGFMQPITDIAHVHGVLSQKFCTAVSFQNLLPGNILQALNQITAQDADTGTRSGYSFFELFDSAR